LVGCFLAEARTRNGLPVLAAEFDEAEALYKKRYKPYNPEFDLLNEAFADPEKYRVFLQSIGLPLSAEIRMVILRLSDGEMIQNIKFDYQRGSKSKLRFRMIGEHDYIDAPYAFDVLILPQLSYFATGNKLEIGPMRPWQMPDSAK
jgi:hypothetical protein